MRKFLIATLLVLATTNIKYSGEKLLLIPKKELRCLVDNVYHESRSEPIEGQILVARVTLNRAVEMSKICKTVFARKQFSWVGIGVKVRDKKAYNAAWDYSLRALYRKEAVYYFHTLKVKPSWSAAKRRVAVIGGHVFYEDK